MENPKSLGSNMGVATKMAREKEDLHYFKFETES
jgi:hypothetical protein